MTLRNAKAMSYTKLDQNITSSTVWREPNHVRVTWITLLAMVDKHGEVHASIPGLADIARVTIQECEDALNRFKSPDPYSRTKDFEGRRIEDIDGGWFLLNYAKYRRKFSAEEKLDRAADRNRRYRERLKRNQASRDTPSDAGETPNSDIADADADADADAFGSSDISKPNEQSTPSILCRDESRRDGALGAVLIAETPADSAQGLKTPRKAVSDAARAILDFLNNAASRAFEPVEANLRPIQHRLTEVGCDVDGVKAMITRQCVLWKTDDKMAAYLRPATLFNRTKFHSYYADRSLPARNGHARSQGAGADRNSRIGGGDAWEAQAAARIARMEEHCPWDPREPSPQGQTGG